MSTTQDIARRDAIHEYRVLSTPAGSDLEALVELAATICGVPTAVINIIDEEHQHQVASIGFEPGVCAREDSMCNAVLEHPEPVVVRDAREDARFRESPFVTGDIASVRFYASSPLRTPDGVAIGTLCIFDEAPGELGARERRALELLSHQVVEVLELRRLTRELDRSNEQLTHFAAQVSHDLRNPLSALVGFLELASSSEDIGSAAAAIARAEGAAARMGAMVDGLLDHSRAGGAARREDVHLDRILADTLDDLDALIVATGARVDAGPLPVVTGDPVLLRLLLQNLLSNALQHGGAAGRGARVEVGAHALTSGWRITVDDDGPGVPEHDRERVFDAMERGDAGHADGLGLGLSTCRRIVRAHGGRIGIDDAPSGGASVWVVLPASA
ncbi:GAF domain-containing sensor histidine kinase [Agrococcus sediminis]|uniref:Sensor-like histidine kinase SenX3 n=1 Tax=Agrococcus sediminis TaxID=2599924 RepID=A0A5M8QCR3_9MICO|nr:GAF domain-containing sensor histidine kinase [Agrococcus sediminis]KAA6432841.1 GAF domain-containing sensor histidine kinase [Agrococcus sediminis]